MTGTCQFACVQVLILGALTATAAAQSQRVQRLLDVGNDAFADGNYQRAGTLWDRAICSEPSRIDPAHYSKRADVFLLRKHYASGSRWIERVAEPMRPDDPLVLEKKAILLHRIVSAEIALQLNEQLVEQHPPA